MSIFTPHTYRNRRGTFAIRFDELEPENTITMCKATFEKLAGVKVDSGVPDRTAIRIGIEQPKTAATPTAKEWDSWTPDAKDAFLKDHPGTVINDPVPPVVDHEANASLEEKHDE